MPWRLLLVILVVLVVWTLVRTALDHRRHAALTDRRPCGHCGAVFPADARFCGRCGKPLRP